MFIPRVRELRPPPVCLFPARRTSQLSTGVPPAQRHASGPGVGAPSFLRGTTAAARCGPRAPGQGRNLDEQEAGEEDGGRRLGNF